MLRVGANLGDLLDRADQVLQGMEAMQNALVSILKDLKSGDASIEDVELVRDPQTGQVISVQVNKNTEDDE